MCSRGDQLGVQLSGFTCAQRLVFSTQQIMRTMEGKSGFPDPIRTMDEPGVMQTRLNRNAANALLKICEEPPAQALILLTATVRGRLLPTIRSRCRSLALAPLSPTELTKVIQPYAHDLGNQDLEMLTKLCAGSPGSALQIIENDGLAIYRDLLNLLQISGPEQQAAVMKFCLSFGGKADGERFALVTQYCQDWLARLCILAATGAVKEIVGGEGQLLRRLVAIKPLANWFEVADNLQKQFAAALYANLDRKLVLMQCLQQMIATK